MKIGVIFPQTEIRTDAGGVRAYAEAAEELGFSHILAYEHVLGANTDSRPGWSGAYRLDDGFYEPFPLFAFLAAATTRIGFATGVVILPQRQAVLVAKQAATLDVLCGGRLRLRLGVGLGWNEVEYEALGMNFRNRGRRVEEQIDLIRQLWTHDSITFNGRYHTVTDAGINPRPAQPIPVWMGGSAEPALRRMARLADGWIGGISPDDDGARAVDRIRGYVQEAGRDPAGFGLDTMYGVRADTRPLWPDQVSRFREFGMNYISVNTMKDGLRGADAHISRITEFKETVGSLNS